MRAIGLWQHRDTNPECFWLRGIVPRYATYYPEPHEDNWLWNINENICEWFIEQGNIYTDGSGGEFSNDKRIRRVGCAWAFVYPGQQSHKMYHGQNGHVVGRQTVPRAELRALIAAMQAIRSYVEMRQYKVNINITIHIDNKGVVLGTTNKAKTLKTNNVDLWTQYWEVVEQLHHPDITIKIQKVKGHATEEDIRQGIITKEHAWGNTVADEWAKTAASRHLVVGTITQDARQRVTLCDRWATLIQKRALAICQLFLKKAARYKQPEEQDQAYRITNKYKMEQLGHSIVQVGNTRSSCTKCLQIWLNRQLNVIIGQGRKCYGTTPWINYGDHGNRGLATPLQGIPMHLTGKAPHVSHSIAYLTEHGIVFCQRCGYHAKHMLRKLALPCHKTPPTKSTRRRRDNMLHGLHPLHRP